MHARLQVNDAARSCRTLQKQSRIPSVSDHPCAGEPMRGDREHPIEESLHLGRAGSFHATDTSAPAAPAKTEEPSHPVSDQCQVVKGWSRRSLRGDRPSALGYSTAGRFPSQATRNRPKDRASSFSVGAPGGLRVAQQLEERGCLCRCVLAP